MVGGFKSISVIIHSAFLLKNVCVKINSKISTHTGTHTHTHECKHTGMTLNKIDAFPCSVNTREDMKQGR